METYFYYIFLSAICLTVFYFVIRIIPVSWIAFRVIRFYILTAILISLLLPFTPFQIVLPERPDKAAEDVNSEPVMVSGTETGDRVNLISGSYEPKVSWYKNRNVRRTFVSLYFIVSGILCLRLLLGLIKIILIWYRADRIKHGTSIIHQTSSVNNSFSFFRWIFVNSDGKTSEEIKNIIAHESIHVSQFHSTDNILAELLTAVMWFNPVLWMMRKTLQQLHEYLADEGVLLMGISEPAYKALLVNQVAEERLIAFSSGFHSSLIKKRLIMMTKPKFDPGAGLKILVLVPVAAILLFGVACVNGKLNRDRSTVTAIAPVKMNVMYLGLDNPVEIAVSGYDPSEIEIEVDNGRIEGREGKYIIRPYRPGTLKIEVFANGRQIKSSVFRVKTVPNPVAKVGGKNGGTISKEELLKAGRVYVEMENFDFDLSFEVVSYVMSATVPGTYRVREEISRSETFSRSQEDLIRSLLKNQKLMIEEIKVKVPDGSIRKLGSIVFTIG
ncbi:MAG: GldM family protein [Bacteroidales bacterium]|jgi:hypothetical protein